MKRKWMYLQGGSWDFDLRFARVANRVWVTPDYRNSSLGLRLVRRKV